MSKFNDADDLPDDDYYLERMKEILEGYPKLGGPLGHPSKVLEHVYIGNQDNSDNIDLLQALEITHVLNCAGTRTFDLTRSHYPKNSGIVGFLMIPAEDYEEYDIMQYFMDTNIFLDKVKMAGGRALVHCNIGVNRSGAIVAAYLMVHQNKKLLKVIDDLKSKRSLVLQNVGFRRQLVRFARCRGLLDPPDFPLKKTSRNSGGCADNGSKKEAKVAQDHLERNELTKDFSNGTSTNGGGEHHEVASWGGTNSTREFTSNLASTVNHNTGSGKYSGYEDDLYEETWDRPKNRTSYFDSPILDRSYNRISYLDLPYPLGSSSSKSEHALSNGSVSYLIDRSLLPSGGDVPSSLYQKDFKTRSILAATRLDPLDYNLSPFSLETSLTRSSGLTQHPSSSYYAPRHLPIDAYSPPTHISRESSVPGSVVSASLDNDLTSKYNTSNRASFAPVSSSYFESDASDKSRDLIAELPPRAVSMAPSSALVLAGRFVSTVKPRSYYQKLVCPAGPLRARDDFGREYEFDDIVRDRRSSSRSIAGGSGMLFTPYFASSPSSLLLSSTADDILYQPRPYIDKNYTLENYDRNSSYSRLNGENAPYEFSPPNASLYDYPQRTNNNNAHYRSHSATSRTTSYPRSSTEYDDALDEYSDLLHASTAKSSAINWAGKARTKSGTGAGTSTRRLQSYRY